MSRKVSMPFNNTLNQKRAFNILYKRVLFNSSIHHILEQTFDTIILKHGLVSYRRA